jgi:hypothetical protein
MSKDWIVGEIYGNNKLIAATATEATFELPDGSKVTYPNIFQRKTTPVSPYPTKKVDRVLRQNASQTALLAKLEAKKATLAAISAICS